MESRCSESPNGHDGWRPPLDIERPYNHVAPRQVATTLERAAGSEETLVIGQTLSHYRVTAALGAGGMGEVYRATDTNLGRDVAIKVLPPEVAQEDPLRARATWTRPAVDGLGEVSLRGGHAADVDTRQP